MKVFKFGGASVKDADGVRNVCKVIQHFPQDQLMIVVSAMGKTTNALENLTKAHFNNSEKKQEILSEIKSYHFNIIDELFPLPNHSLREDVHNLFVELEWVIDGDQIRDYDFEYDQIVSFGELISTRIVAAFLNECGMPATWVDARDLIATDNTYREGRIDWDKTGANVQEKIAKAFSVNATQRFLTQGFIGGTSENFTTTLGREGSDYTAAILAFCLDAHSVTIWKDVPGVLNADPKYFPEAILIPKLSYYDAVELAYYGATVIHPKTIKPLQNKNIPLYVRSFIKPEDAGTEISDNNDNYTIPSYIFKNDLVLISIWPKDFSFVVEKNISDLFTYFAQNRVKVHLMQNSALNFSVCISGDKEKIEKLLKDMDELYFYKFNDPVQLVTIRNYTERIIEKLSEGKELLLEQKSRHNVQLVLQ
ncbi:MAG: aspartate kinase [Flavobacteriales bacterium]